jgi:hypothetical protein
MCNRRWLHPVGLVLLAALVSGCATAPAAPPTLAFEEHTLRIPLTVQANGSVSLAESPPLIGRIDLAPILQAEGVRAGAVPKPVVQLVVHFGRFYVVADGFRSIWEITPQPGLTTASYRPIPIVADAGAQPGTGTKAGAAAKAEVPAKTGSGARPVRDPRLSRYGSARSSCVRLDRANGPPVFITPKGEAANACP